MLVSGDSQAARSAILGVLPALAEKIEQMRDEKNCKVWLMSRLRERLLKNPPHPKNEDLVEPAARFSQIPEPGRSALALLCLDLFSATDIAQILQIPLEQLPAALDTARSFLNGPASPSPGKIPPLWKCHRAGNSAPQDARVQKAVRLAADCADTKAALDAQTAFDDALVAQIRSIEPGDEFLHELAAAFRAPSGGFQLSALRQPPFIAGAVAVLVVIGVLVYLGMNMAENFPGKDVAVRMLDMTEEMTGIELEPKVAEAGSLEDWFFGNGYEGFHLLPEFAHMKTVGCRVFRHDGYPVGQIAIENHNLLLYIFNASDLDVTIDPPDRWRFFQQGEWTAAIRADAGTCYMVTFRGNRADMEKYIAGLAK